MISTSRAAVRPGHDPDVTVPAKTGFFARVRANLARWMIWAERCRAAGLRIQWKKYMLASTVAAVLALAATVGALLLAI